MSANEKNPAAILVLHYITLGIKLKTISKSKEIY